MITPREQMNVLATIWGKQNGWVFLPHITNSGSRRVWHEGPAFAWPGDRAAILEYLRDHDRGDLFFTPAVYLDRERKEYNLAPEHCLWADLDEADPHEFPDHLRPSIAWESSPNRYQAVWLMRTSKVGASWPGNENQRLTDHVGADPSGWDSTQVLRVPGRANHKPERMAGNKGRPVPGQLLWSTRTRHPWATITQALPETHKMRFAGAQHDAPASAPGALALKRVQGRLTRDTRARLKARVPDGDRSEVLFGLEKDLLRAGCTPEETFSILEASCWNKFTNRPDQLHRDIRKAATEVASTVPDGRHVEIVRASSITPKATHWVWDGRLARGSLGLLAGNGGLGKSQLTYWLASQLTRGTLDGVFLGKPKDVLVAATEDSWEHTIVPRLMAAGADLDRIGQIRVRHDDRVTGLQLAEDLEALRDAVRANDAGLLIFDPLMSRMSTKLSTSDDNHVRSQLEPLVALADEEELAVLGIMHHNKSSGSGDPVNAVLASVGFTNVARSVHSVVRDPDSDGERLFGTPKNNLGRDDLPTRRFRIVGHDLRTPSGEVIHTSRVEWLGESSESIRSVMKSAMLPDEEKNQVTRCAEWLIAFLAQHGGACESSAVREAAEQAGFNLSTLNRGRGKAGVLSERRSEFGGGSTWALPVPR